MTRGDEKAGLRGMLEIERECCIALAAVLERERDAASSHDLPGLLTSNREREATQAHWERISGHRRATLREAGASLDDLIRGDGALEDLCDDIAERARGLQRAQSVNRGLVGAVLGQVTGLIDTIRRELPSSRYDREAALTAPLPSGGGASWSA